MLCPPYLPTSARRLNSALLSAVCAFLRAVSSIISYGVPPTVRIFACAMCFPSYESVNVTPDAVHDPANVMVSPDAVALDDGQ